MAHSLREEFIATRSWLVLCISEVPLLVHEVASVGADTSLPHELSLAVKVEVHAIFHTVSGRRGRLLLRWSETIGGFWEGALSRASHMRSVQALSCEVACVIVAGTWQAFLTAQFSIIGTQVLSHRVCDCTGLRAKPWFIVVAVRPREILFSFLKDFVYMKLLHIGARDTK